MIDLKEKRLSTAMERPQLLSRRYNSISLKVRRLSSDNFLPFGHTPEQRATKSPIQKESFRKKGHFWLLSCLNYSRNFQAVRNCKEKTTLLGLSLVYILDSNIQNQKESLRKLKGFWLLSCLNYRQQDPSCENSLRKLKGFWPFSRIYIRGAF